MRHAPVDAAALIRGMFHQVSNKPQPGMGVFPVDWLDTSFLPVAVRKDCNWPSSTIFILLKTTPRAVKLALAHGCTFAAEPAGLFGWLDTGVDTDALAQRMLDEGYLIAPGSLFHAVRKPGALNLETAVDRLQTSGKPHGY